MKIGMSANIYHNLKKKKKKFNDKIYHKITTKALRITSLSSNFKRNTLSGYVMASRFIFLKRLDYELNIIYFLKVNEAFAEIILFNYLCQS